MRALLLLALSAGILPGQRPAGKEVLTFYYGWYGNPQVGGRWVHWKDVDPAAKRIGSSAHFPALGAYDSHDPKIVRRHMEQAKRAGLTGFIVSWWAQRDFHDEGMPLLLDEAAKAGLKITVYFETVHQGGPLPDINYLLERYGKHAAWLKVGSKPVLFIYGRAVGQLKLDGWKQAIADTPGAVFMGDQISERAAGIFHGIHTYNITGRIARKSVDEIRAWARENYPAAVKTAGGKIACITVIPGYDDTSQSRPEPRPITDRHGGRTYRVLWEEAIAARPDWVLITSWNEWHEGSEIEPSAENGERELKTTREYTRRFLKP